MTLEAQRTRMIGTLFGGNALASTAFITAVTVTSIVAKEITGSAALAGLPAAAGTLGSALGSATLSNLSRRFGRRPAFSLGYAIAAVGAVIAAFSVGGSSIGFLTFGMFVLGAGRSVSALSRYAAGDMRTSERRATAISFVVWASTIGSVAGRYLVPIAGRYGTERFDNEFVGPFVFTAVGFLLASIAYVFLLRPDPMKIAVGSEEEAGDASKGRSISELVQLPSIRLALVTLVVSQTVMTVLMVMAPVHARDNGADLTFVSQVLMVHTLGMFAFAPITGALIRRFTARPMILVASAMLISSGLVAYQAPNAERLPLLIAMFLVGLGWNVGYVSGATVLQESLTLDDRVRVQGFTDATVWVSAGLAAAGSGFVMRSSSYGMLGIIGAIISVAPIVALLRARQTKSPELTKV